MEGGIWLTLKLFSFSDVNSDEILINHNIPFAISVGNTTKGTKARFGIRAAADTATVTATTPQPLPNVNPFLLH